MTGATCGTGNADEGDKMLLIAFQWISEVDGCVSLEIGVHIKERLASGGSWLIGEFFKLFMNRHFHMGNNNNKIHVMNIAF